MAIWERWEGEGVGGGGRGGGRGGEMARRENGIV